MTKIFQAFLFIHMLTSMIYAHDPMDLATPEQKIKMASDLSAFLEIAFVEASRVRPSDPRFFIFLGQNGERFYVEQTQVARSLVRAAELSAGQASSPSFSCNHGRACSHDHSHAVKISLKDKSEATNKLLSRFQKLERLSIRLLGGATELANQHGLIPLAVIIATWPIFTIGSEVLESLAMGPLHVVCHASQVAYFSALGFFLLQGRVASDILLTKGSSAGIWGRMKQVWRSRKHEKVLRKSLERIFLEEMPVVIQRSDFQNFLHENQNMMSSRVAASMLWGDLYQKLVSSKLEADISESGSFDSGRSPDIAFIFSDGAFEERSSRAYEIYESLLVFSGLVRTHLFLAYETKKLPPSEFLHRKKILGKWLRSLELFRRGMWLAAQEQDKKKQAQNAEWAYSTLKLLLESLSEISKLNSDNLSVSKMQKDLEIKVLEYRKGNLEKADCSSFFLPVVN